jgi:hypothetical protein
MVFELGEQVMIQNGPHKGKTGILVEMPYGGPFSMNMDDGTGIVTVQYSDISEYPKVYPLEENFTVNVRDERFWYIGSRAVTRALVEVLAKNIVSSTDDRVRDDDWIKLLGDRIWEMNQEATDRHMEEEAAEKELSDLKKKQWE